MHYPPLKAKTLTRISQFRIISPTTKKTVGYERLTLSTNGTLWEFSEDDKHWETGIYEGEWLRDIWTGRVDPDDVKIYENDLLDYAGHVNHVVFRGGSFGYFGSKSNFNSRREMFPIYDKQRVVGNIHQQPELHKS